MDDILSKGTEKNIGQGRQENMPQGTGDTKMAVININTAASIIKDMKTMINNYSEYMTADRNHDDSNFLTSVMVATGEEVQIRKQFNAINEKCLQAIDLANKAKPDLPSDTPQYNPDEIISDAYYYLGHAYEIRHKFPEAKAQFIKSLEAFPNADAQYFIGVLLEKQGQKQEAISAFQKVVTDFPDSERAIEANKKITAPDKSSSGCFVATACFGNYSAPEVMVLRKFRDECLVNSKVGRIFINYYYKFGPSVANLLNQHDWMKILVRKLVLHPIVKSVKLFMK
ncbi:MAG: tetratricopeptide repeat protein [Endomicrobiaceae bacterium]|nr:tetratricopeptide repeat protein [Endomicrobiaceae bacterium]